MHGTYQRFLSEIGLGAQEEFRVLRIIAGSCRGKRLFTPGGHGIRPTPDKVKGAIFNMIGASQEDAVALDLFSGTGSMGLEALSRGARRCYFCDNSAESLALIRKNAAHCNMEARAKILSGDYMRTLDAIPEKMDVIFIDPPYGSDYYANCLERVAAAGLLQAD
ncbi:MAG: 16S rRNA (guanine(966)-N(2))-methyltransferase RsmD, partial [Clostridiales Family XIII bacterium]|nr:16S rRNA (guanine(966)-N(2))-methyltransferase RsmD [Clostridiales Family XIII bacterium]